MRHLPMSAEEATEEEATEEGEMTTGSREEVGDSATEELDPMTATGAENTSEREVSCQQSNM